MRLLAISDLHVGHQVNRLALEALPSYPDDWLIVAGDVGETEQQLRFTLTLLTQKFAKVFWVPGNHELWTTSHDSCLLQGEPRYLHLVSLCQSLGVVTPEDPYVTWPGEGGPCVIAPMFVLYDYTFRPDEIPASGAIAWAMESGILCQDEYLLHYDPYESRVAFCEARVQKTLARLKEIPEHLPSVLVNHFPLRREHAVLPMIPRFTIWCGTTQTEDWHTRFRAKVVVTGHLHIRSTRHRDGTRFEEVSLGYPKHWQPSRGAHSYLRQILP